MVNCSLAPNHAQIHVSANGVYNIPKEAGVMLVRDLFEGVGVDRLREDRYFANLTFSDVKELDSIDLTAAICVGLDHLTDPVRDHSVVKDALLKRLEEQFPHRRQFIFRVGCSCKMMWPNHRTLMR